MFLSGNKTFPSVCLSGDRETCDQLAEDGGSGEDVIGSDYIRHDLITEQGSGAPG